MEFRVLGPLQVISADATNPQLAPRQATLLAVLLLADNETVPISQLVDAVWGDDPPVTARRQVQNGIWMLRRLVPITAAGSGYRLALDDHRIDSRTFVEHVARARALASHDPGAALRYARTALELWRGPALLGCSGRVVEAAAARLNDERAATQELCLELELRLGRSQAAAAELAELVKAYPLRERLVGLLMQALQRSGRPSEALEAYQSWRRRLADELGLDPSAELQAVHAAILRGDDVPRPGPAAGLPQSPLVIPRQLPTVVRNFVGRSAELKELDALLAPAPDRATVGAIAAICGPAGIGKTTLALRWAQDIAAEFPDGQLHVNLRGYDPTGNPVAPAEALRDFLDALGVPAPRMPRDLEPRAALYRSLVADRRMVIVLDNALSADQIRPLLPGSESCAVVITSRSPLTGLVAETGTRPFTLDVLGHSEARDLLIRRLGAERVQAEWSAADDLIVQCGRLPLALAIIAARAAAHPEFALASFATELRDQRRRLDALDSGDPVAQVRAAFSWSCRRLSPAAARLFRLLGLHPGPDIGIAAAASLAGRPVAAVQPLLAELVEVHLLAERAPGRLTAHDLVRAYSVELGESLDRPEDREVATQRILDHYLHSAYAAALLTEPFRQPIAIPLGEPAAGTRAERFTDPAAALAWLDAETRVLLEAVDQAYGLGLDERCWQLSWTLSRRLHLTGQWLERLAVQQTGLAAARRLGHPRAQAYSHQFVALSSVILGRHDEAHGHHLVALAIYETLGDVSGQASTHVNVGACLEGLGRIDEALGHAEQALELFRRLGDPRGIADSLNAVGWYASLAGQYEYGLRLCTEALAQYEREVPESRSSQALTLDSIGYAQHGLNRLDEAIETYHRALRLFEETGDQYFHATTLNRLGDLHHEVGDDAAARNCWHRALTILTALGHADAIAVHEKL